MAAYRSLGALPLDASGNRINCIDWWYANKQKFPHMASLAMTVLGVPASSAAVERLFSIAGDVITDDRNRLSADLASKLIFLRATWGPLEEYLRQLEEKRKTTR